MNKAFFVGLVLFLLVQAQLSFSIDCDDYDSYEECLADYISDLEDQSCSILNIADCIPEKIYDFFIDIINSPLLPMIALVKLLLSEPVNVSIYDSIWAIMLYIISMFYGFLMLYAGFNFMVSGSNAAKRANAKEWLKNLFIMIILVQASYYLYSIVVKTSGLMTLAVVNLIDGHFFMFTFDNINSIGLQLTFGFYYLVMLSLAVVILALRYILVAAGVAIAPLAIFLYFIPPLRSYGKLMLNFLGTSIFITFLDAIVLLICSKITEIELFANYKILVMISAFTVINILMFYFLFFAALKSAFKTGSKVVNTIVAIGKYFV